MIEIRPARDGHFEPVCELLRGAGLPTEDLDPGLSGFFVASVDGSVVGVVGLEVHEGYGLLRSLAVAPENRRAGLGAALCGHVISCAVGLGLAAVFLLTENADGFFRRHGFEEVSRDSAPGPIRASREFSSLCPTSATLMRHPLGGSARGP